MIYIIMSLFNTVSCTGWKILYIACFINSCILLWIISGITPMIVNEYPNPILLFALSPLIAVYIIHKCYKLNSILPIYVDPESPVMYNGIFIK